MVCAERTIGLEIILGELMVLLRDMGQVKTHFDPFGDNVNLERLTYHWLKNYFGRT
jgi:class 3 adenylate cyclase